MLEKKAISGNIIAQNVSFDEWMQKYAEDHTEWINGTVVKWFPVNTAHNDMDIFFCLLMGAYLDETNEAVMLRHPFILKLN